MSLNNWFLVFMGICYLVPPIVFQRYFLALAFIIYGLVFGFTEFCAAFYSGQTISQQMFQLVQDHKTWEGIIICSGMILATVFLVLHLMGVGRR